MPPTPAPTHRPISPIYSLILLTIEPLTALAGFIAAHFFPAFYLAQTVSFPNNSSTDLLPRLDTATHITLRQLANLYLLFALNEAFVLRAASYTRTSNSAPTSNSSQKTNTRTERYVNIKVWRALLLGLLVADLGHLWSLRLLGLGAYWRVWEWNGMGWGNFGVVYAGITTRVCFLMGVGVGESQGGDEGKDR